MASKTLALVLDIIGVVLIAFGIKSINASILKFLPFLTFLGGFKPVYLMIAGLCFLIVGILLMKQGSVKADKEVPIYHKNKIVGYRRH